MKTLTRRNLEDYIIGSEILGCGGGGSAEEGRTMVEDAFKRGFEFRLAGIEELPDDDFICILGGVGGGVPVEVRKRVEPYFRKFKITREDRMRRLQKAARELSDFIGEEFCSYIPSETGPGNGVIPMYLAAREGKPCIDGDCCGRAKPEIAISLTNVAGIQITPLSMVTPFDEVLILKKAIDDTRAEDLCRYAAIASGGVITVARCPARVEEYRRGIVPNQMIRCMKIGEAVRGAREKGREPTEAFMKVAHAHKLFEGRVISHEIEGRGGFNWGDCKIEGRGKFEKHAFRIWFKNENLISWMDEKPYVTCPDLICVVDSKTCQGLSNFVKSGKHNDREVTIFGIKAHERWKTKKGVEIFSPKHFGFDIEYTPLK